MDKTNQRKLNLQETVLSEFINKNFHSNLSEKSIAVLPFVNMSSDPDNEYFSDGITEEIINALTKINGLKVVARTSSFSFKGKNEDVRKIGNLLGVTSVLEGSVRKNQNRIRITAQLINSVDGTHFWSEIFDREMKDIFELQDEISLLIADQIRENFGHFDIQEHLFNSYTKSVEAFNEYKKGRFFQLKWDVENFKKAIEHYRKAITTDPEFPLPYCGIVMCYTYMYSWNATGKEEAKIESAKCLKKVKHINSRLPEYHLAVSSAAILFDWDFDLALKELHNVLQINQNQTDALESLAGLYIVTGNFDKGLHSIDKALLINPLSANHHFMKGNILYFMGEYEKAILWLDKSLQIDQQMILAVQLKLSSLILLNDRSRFQKLRDENKHYQFAEHYNNLQKLVNEGEKAEIAISSGFENEFQPWQLYFFAHTGNLDGAIKLLKDELKSKTGLYFCFRYDPFLKPLWEDERFQLLTEQYLNFSAPQLIAESPSSEVGAQKLSSNEREKFLKRLQQLMVEEKVFLNPSLTLKLLSDLLEIHPNKLSWLINESHNKNFNELINQFRLAHFKEIACDEKNAHITILGLAYESGFNSKSVFNTYFKKAEGTTPGDWLKQSKR